MRIIGLAGPKRSGKDTAARYLCEQHGFLSTSFAAPLRSFCCDTLGIDFDELDATKEQTVPWLDGVSPRSFMQLAGTEFGRHLIHPELWVRSAMQRIERCPTAPWVLSDVRFPNEARAIRDRGGLVLRMNGRGELGDRHVSEDPLPAALVDHEIDNSGSQEWLQEQLDAALERLGRATSGEG